MKEYIRPARGAKRLYDISALPCIDLNSEIRYYGSIAKCGDNSDWDWGMYRDENGEWVLAEADGAGCIFNFTQHRYPTSAVPTFRFYFDNSPTPQYELTPADFGKKAPFLSPLADIFEGPEDEGRGPIWVVRSFVPMEFKTHCKVTSTIKLEGCHKADGAGGWGHVTMQLYDNAESLVTFSGSEDISELANKYTRPLSLEFTDSHWASLKLGAKECKSVFSFNKESTLAAISAEVEDFKEEMMADLFIKISFDGKQTVWAPFGTFFGCEYSKSPAKLDTALLTSDFSGKTAFFENRYPMPFFESAVIEIENRGKSEVTISRITAQENDSLCFEKGETGIFTSSDYYPPTANEMGKNSVIADVSGHGQMVYGVVSGDDIRCGCEGDVRIFIDGLRSPAVESDGTESWGSYGWGFVVPPQCNPFSAYNGLYNSNDFWSELRLTFTDCYPFRSRLRFELEHGCQNDGGGTHSGQIFCYMLPETSEEELIEIPCDSENFSTNGTVSSVTDRFENGIHENYETVNICCNQSKTTLSFSVPAENNGIVLKRVCSQKNGRMSAEIAVNGEKVTEREWLYPDYNDIYSLLEDTFTIPARYTKGKTELEVAITPSSGEWNEASYKIFAIKER